MLGQGQQKSDKNLWKPQRHLFGTFQLGMFNINRLWYYMYDWIWKGQPLKPQLFINKDKVRSTTFRNTWLSNRHDYNGNPLKTFSVQFVCRWLHSVFYITQCRFVYVFINILNWYIYTGSYCQSLPQSYKFLETALTLHHYAVQISGLEFYTPFARK